MKKTPALLTSFIAICVLALTLLCQGVSAQDGSPSVFTPAVSEAFGRFYAELAKESSDKNIQDFLASETPSSQTSSDTSAFSAAASEESVGSSIPLSVSDSLSDSIARGSTNREYTFKKASEETSCLIIGTSLSYYNNMPEMFGRIVKLGTGRPVDCTVLTYSGRTLQMHAKAIDAVIRTGGHATKLSQNEKRFFLTKNRQYDARVYRAYKNAVFHKDGSLKEYDYIILQEKGQNRSYEKYKNGTFGILKNLCTKDTDVVLPMAPTRMRPGCSLEEYVSIIAQQNLHADSLKAELDASGLSHSVAVSYVASTYCNYYDQFGKYAAITRVPNSYTVYLKHGGTRNDLLMSDGIHPTQLGSYIYACSLYSTIYGKDAYQTVKSYSAATTSSQTNCRTLHAGPNYALNRTFIDEDLLKATATLAYQTQNKTLSLPSSDNTKLLSPYFLTI